MEPLSMGPMGRTNDQQCPVCLVPHFPFCNHAHPSVAYPPQAAFPGQTFAAPRPMVEAPFRGNYLASVPPRVPDFQQGHPHYGSNFPSRNDQFYHQRIEHASAARVFLPGSTVPPPQLFPRHADLTHQSAQHPEYNVPPMIMMSNSPPGHSMVNCSADGRHEKEQLFFQQQRQVVGAIDTPSPSGFGSVNAYLPISGPAKAPRYNDADGLQLNRQTIDHGLQQMGYKTGMLEADEATRAIQIKSQPYDGQAEQYVMARETSQEGKGAAFEQGTAMGRDASFQDNSYLGKALRQFYNTSFNSLDISYREKLGWSQQPDLKSSDYKQGVPGGPYTLSERCYLREAGQRQESKVENDFGSAQASVANNLNQPETRKGPLLGIEERSVQHSLQTFECNEPVQSDSRAQHSSLAKVLDVGGGLQTKEYPSRDPPSERKNLKRKCNLTERQLQNPISREEELLVEQGLLDDDSSGSGSPNYPSMVSKEVLAAKSQPLHSLVRSAQHGKESQFQSQSESYNSNQWEQTADRSWAGRFSNNLGERVSNWQDEAYPGKQDYVGWPVIDRAVDRCDNISSNERLYPRGFHASHDERMGEVHPSLQTGSTGQYRGEGTQRGKDILPEQYQHWEAEQQHMEALRRAQEIAREIQQREESVYSLKPPLVQDAHIKEQPMSGLAWKQVESKMEQQEPIWQSSAFQATDVSHPPVALSRSNFSQDPNCHFKPYSQEILQQEHREGSGSLSAFQQDCQSANASHKEQLEPHVWHHGDGALPNFHRQGLIAHSQNLQLSLQKMHSRSQGEKEWQNEQQLQPRERQPLNEHQFEDYHQNRKHYAQPLPVQTHSIVHEGSRKFSGVNAPSTTQVQGIHSSATDSTLGILNAAQYASSGVQEPHSKSSSSYLGPVSMDSMVPSSPHPPPSSGPPLPPDAPPPLPPFPSMSVGSTSSSATQHCSLDGEVFLQSHLPQSRGPSLQCVDSLQMHSQLPSGQPQNPDKSKVVDAANIFRNPGRLTRPDRFVVILRGLPGSGKSYLAKALRDVEVMNGGSAPRIHSMDDYFMSEVEKIEDDVSSTSGLRSRKKIVKRVMEYCYEPEMEEAYRASMLKAFKKTLEEGMFNFIIVDDRNVLVADFSQFWAIAKRSGYEVYILEASYKDVKGCAARNVHSFTVDQIQSMVDRWEATPSLYLSLDVSSLFRGDDLNAQDIIEVEMDTDDMERDLEDDEDNSHPSDEQFSKSLHLRDKDKPVLGDKWEDKAEHAAEKSAVFTKSTNLVEDSSNIEHTHESRDKGNALSGLMTTYGKTNKFVHWSDNQGVKGGVKRFSIGHKSTSLIIGPGPGYNVTSNPLVEETDKNLAASTRRNSKFVEQLRAEQETFKAAFARRRQRIGGMEEDDDD